MLRYAILLPCLILLTSTTRSPAQEAKSAEVKTLPKFVAVGYGLRRLTSNDGVRWENELEETDPVKSKADDFLLRGVTSGKGLIVAVGGSKTTRILVSADGKNWSEHSVQQNWLGDVAFGNDLFVAVGYQRAMHSRDGKEWSKPTPLRDASWRRIAFGNGRFVGIGAAGATNPLHGFATTSTDGVQWTSTELADSKIPKDIAFGKGRFVVVGTHGLRESSDDGVRWKHRVLGEKDEQLLGVVWTGKEFIAYGNKGAHVSPDGVSWEKGTQRMPSRVAALDGLLVGCGTGRFSFSKDGREWTPAKAEGKLSITKIIAIEREAK